MSSAGDSAFATTVDGLQALTAGMLDAAAAGDWEAVADLDRQRVAGLEGLEVELSRLQAADLEGAVDRLRALVATDGRLSAFAVEARQSALAALRRARGAVRGSARYHQLARER